MSGLVTLNGHVMAVLDVETTGLVAGYHEIVQVAILPLDVNLDQLDVSPFYMNIRPEHPNRADPVAMRVNGLSLEKLKNAPDKCQVADTLDEWFRELNLPLNKRLVYLTQNAPFDVSFMKEWLGSSGWELYFNRRGRDTMFLAQGLNDAAAYKGRPVPFPNVSLKGLCNKLGIDIVDHHDALADCAATAKVYRELLRHESI